MIIIQANKAAATVRQTELLTSGRVGLECRVEFSQEWEGLTKTVVCKAGQVTRDVLLRGETFVVPHECLITSGNDLLLGFYGADAEDEVVIPTIYARVGHIVPGADPSGDPSTDPTLPVYEQLREELQGEIGDLTDLQTEDKSSLVAAINEAAQSGEEIPETARLLKGDGAGGVQEAVPGTDYLEPEALEAATEDLQGQIDAITSRSDVQDVVSTHAELVAYDLPIFPNNIIKVLADETHGGQRSYYRWVVTDEVGAWVYIGSEGSFYTKSQVDDKLAGKMPMLSPPPTAQGFILTNEYNYATASNKKFGGFSGGTGELTAIPTAKQVRDFVTGIVGGVDADLDAALGLLGGEDA